MVDIPEYLEVKTSGIHNRGIFAKYDIRKGTHLIEYVGERITNEESERRYQEQFEAFEKDKATAPGTYLFEIDDDFDIDGDVPWNPARYINHSCDPNAETDIENARIWIIATRDIKAGEEIVYNYGFDLEDAKDHPCWCGTDKCVGYIVDEDHWPELFKLIRKGKLPRPRQAKHPALR